MSEIILSPGDTLVVKVKDTDGEFRIHFDTKKFPNALVVEETSNLPDKAGRQGVLYNETFGDDDGIQMMLDAALEAVEHVGQANWEGRESAAKEWLRRVADGEHNLNLDTVQDEVNER